eukprot:CAMPEP_0172812874 /NCGR_PEP_ID=MMETSP1075-20121228/10309_1 /TAXON_ID=2916 /ORGANISM="Ceratium fusus, Strain PA161109" /LENGTH=197 /DNA_ID=CAMNT_0013652479 /DNA_START=225 /DNA_END=818 /DNA_ORIENTATION=-
MRRTLKTFSEGLQETADQLVFGVRPRILKQDWPWFREYLRPDSYGNSKAYIDLAFTLDRVVVGNEDLLEGAEDAPVKMIRLLDDANMTVWKEGEGRREALLKTWDAMSSTVSSVMTAVNSYAASEPELKEVTSFLPFVLPKEDANKYGRSIDIYNKKCTGILQSGICLELPAGAQQTIAEQTQIGMKVNPLFSIVKG